MSDLLYIYYISSFDLLPQSRAEEAGGGMNKGVGVVGGGAPRTAHLSIMSKLSKSSSWPVVNLQFERAMTEFTSEISSVFTPLQN